MLKYGPASSSVLVGAGIRRRRSNGGRTTTCWHGAESRPTIDRRARVLQRAQQVERQPLDGAAEQQRRARAAGQHTDDDRHVVALDPLEDHGGPDPCRRRDRRARADGLVDRRQLGDRVDRLARGHQLAGNRWPEEPGRSGDRRCRPRLLPDRRVGSTWRGSRAGVSSAGSVTGPGRRRGIVGSLRATLCHSGWPGYYPGYPWPGDWRPRDRGSPGGGCGLQAGPGWSARNGVGQGPSG